MAGAKPAEVSARGASVGFELAERNAETLIADSERGAERFARARLATGSKLGKDPSLELGGSIGRLVAVTGGLLTCRQKRRRGWIVALHEPHREGLGRRGSAMLDGDDELVSPAPHVERGIGPCVEVPRAAQALASPGGGRVLSGVVDDEHGDVVRALHLTQEGEHGAHLGRAVLIDAVQAHERVEHEQSWAERGERRVQALLIALEIESQARRRDDVDRESLERQPARRAQAAQALLDDSRRVLGEVDQHGPRIAHGEAAEAARCAGDAERELEAEPALVALGRAAEDTDAGACPERLDEPGPLGVELAKIAREHDGQSLVRQAVGLHALTLDAVGAPRAPVMISSTASLRMCSSTKSCERS